jgi:hypothetical protein
MFCVMAIPEFLRKMPSSTELMDGEYYPRLTGIFKTFD